jgi:hypothetical protein
MDLLAIQDEKEQLITALPFDIGDHPATMAIRFSRRSIKFVPDAQIEFTYEQIAELCMFYNIMCNKTAEGLLTLFRDEGILGPSSGK